MANPIPRRLMKMSRLYVQALREIVANHGLPDEETTHLFTTTLHYHELGGFGRLVIEIEPDLEAGHIRILAVRMVGGDEGEIVYLKTAEV